jgi:hypothetical protein
MRQSVLSPQLAGPPSLLKVEVNSGIMMVVLILFAVLMDQVARSQRLADEVRVLRGLLAICSFCKRIRNTDGSWKLLDKYIADRTETEFTHGLCAPCARKYYGVEVVD